MKITSITARQIFDSRGWPTVEAEVWAGGIWGRAAVPSGKSTGRNEARELRDGGPAFSGHGVLKAIENIVKIIAPALNGMDVRAQSALDQKMRSLDGTSLKERLGANAILAVSLAAAQTAAATLRQPLWQYLRALAGTAPASPPRLIFNVINGGWHAGGALTFQEYHLMPKAKTAAEQMRLGVEVYHTLAKVIQEKYGAAATNVGDEGGFAPPVKNSLEPFELMVQTAKKLGYGELIELGLDAAASSFFKNNVYQVDGQSQSRENLLKLYESLIRRYPFAEIEDPFAEEDTAGFGALLKSAGEKPLIVGDDLTVSSASRVARAADQKLISAAILKVNQIGTLTEALETARVAQEKNLKVIVSHRSGETEDTFISHLAWAIGAWGFKAGAPARGERTVKYNELLRIEENFRNC